MKLVLGLYSQIPQSAPAPVFQRALSCIHKPVLTYLYNHPKTQMCLYQSSQMMRYLSQNYPEVNLLITSLAKGQRLELLTGTFFQGILSLLPMKDRSTHIELMTTLIRRYYGVKASTFWCFGEIWFPVFISSLLQCGIKRVLISPYNAVTKEVAQHRPMLMNDIGRKMDIVTSSDAASRLVSQYGQNLISLDRLIEELQALIMRNKDEYLTLMINADQLCQGASYHREDDEHLYRVFTEILETASAFGYEIIRPKDVLVSGLGYLEAGWYGRDASSRGLRCFNELFVKNGSYRYLLNRAVALQDVVSTYKKDREVKRHLDELVYELSSGDLFICTTHASPLRVGEHQAYFKIVNEVERLLEGQGEAYHIDQYDLDDDGYEELFCHGKAYTVVYSPRGAAVLELDYLAHGLNVFDAISPWFNDAESYEKKNSFVDTLLFDGRSHYLGDVIFEGEVLNRARMEFLFSYTDDSMNVEVLKHYKLRNQILSLEVTFVNKTTMPLSFVYRTEVCFSLPGCFAYSFDEKRQMLLGHTIEHIKCVRYNDGEKKFLLTFTASEYFTSKEETVFQSEVTTLGSEQFYLYTQMTMDFPVTVEGKATTSLSIATRLVDNKEKK